LFFKVINLLKGDRMSLHPITRHLRALLLSAALVAASAAEDDPLAALTAQAIAHADAGLPTALAELEAVLECSPAMPPPVEAGYWKRIVASGDWPRAYLCFSAIARARPDDAEARACEADAIGGYVGWLFQHGLGRKEFPRLDRAATAAFDAALRLDPRNFTALLGRATYDGRTPGRRERCKADFEKLEALRA
jgi:hypothetical protein